MVYMLFDNPGDKDNMKFLKDHNETASFETIFPKEQCKSITAMAKMCIHYINKTSTNDVIICWYDFMGILCWWISKLFCKKRQIVVLNILLKNKKSLKNKVAKILYKVALKSNNVKATVTSEEYGNLVNKFLGINKNYTLLHDIYHGGYQLQYDGITEKRSVFCGGRNGRDWEFLLKLSEEMPDVQFNIVLTNEQYEKYKDIFGNNVNAKSEILNLEFLQLMCQSSLVVMPLDTEAPAGLIAMYQAAANGKMVITSDTVTTREYLKDNKGVLCKNNISEWKSQIEYWLEHKDEATTYAEKLKAFLETECSERNYVEILQSIVSK